MDGVYLNDYKPALMHLLKSIFKGDFQDYAPLFIRLPIGFHLIYGTQDNVFSWSRMLEFREFLDVNGFPVPLLCALVSVYAQFICGALYILGYRVRPAACVMIFNFIVALVMVHSGDSYPVMFPAIMMLFGSLYLLLNGPGRFSLSSS